MAQSRKLSGGTVALRGYIYQFDRTLLEVFSHPDDAIRVERPYDIHGTGWCGEVKFRSAEFYPSSIGDGVVALWKVHNGDPDAELWLHCHFTDQDPGTLKTYTAKEIRANWGEKLKDGKGAPSLARLGKFSSRLRVHFTPDLASQFDEVVDRIKSLFGKDTTEDAVATHAILRALLLDIAGSDAQDKAVSLATLKDADHRHRACVLDHGYRAHLSDAAYERVVRRTWFPSTLNRIDADRFLLIDVPSGTEAREVQSAALAFVSKFGKLPSGRTGNAPRSPILAIRGVAPAALAAALDSLFDRLEGAMPPRFAGNLKSIEDGYPFAGSRFRPERLVDAGDKRSAQLRFVHPGDIANSKVQALASSSEFYYHICLGDVSPPLVGLSHASRISVSSVAQLLRIVS